MLNDVLVLQNESGGTVDINSNQSIQAGGLGGGTIENEEGATFQVNSPAPSISAAFDEQGGTIGVSSGTTFTLAGGGIGTGGIFSVSGSSSMLVLGINGLPLNLSGTYTGTGSGTVAITADNSLIFGNTGATFNFPGTMLQWTAGGIQDISGGDLTNLGTITFAGTAAKFFGEGSTLENKGTIIQTGTGNLELSNDNPDFPTTLQNDAGALYEIEGDSSIVTNGAKTAIDNAGTIEKTGGTGTSTIAVDEGFSNTGTILADSGTLALSATIAQVSGSTLTGGTWNALGGSTIQFPTGTSLTTNQARVTLGGAGASIPALASLASNSGSLTVTGGATLTTAGNLSNTGTVTVGPASTLNVGGTFTEGPTSTLDLDFGGSPASGQFGQLAVTGSAALGGTLQSEFVNGYAPTVGDSFKIISFASATGKFAATNSPVFRGGNVFQFQTNATNITFTAATSVAELGVTSVTASPSSVQTGQDLTVNYSVQNTGNATSVSSWVDSVFLSSGPAINASAVLLGQVTHTGSVAAGGTYSGTLTAAVPAVAPGSYFIVVEVDSQGFVAESNRAGNVLATTSPVQVTVPGLALAAAGATPTPATGTLAAGQSTAFQLQVPAGQTVQISAGFNTASAGELLVGYRAVPTQAANLEQAFVPGQSQQQVTLSNTQQGTYYVVLLGEPGAGSGAPFVLTAQEQPFGIDSFTPGTGSNAGAVTVALTGTLFTRETTVSLVAPGGTATPAIGVTFQNSTTLEAAFNLTGLSAGSYHLRVQNGAQSSTATAPFTVTTGNPGQLALHLSVPSAFRPGRPVTVTVEYENTGDTDIPAPLLELSADTGELELNGQANFTTTGSESGGPNVAFLGTNPDGLASVLPPGAQGQATFTFVATAAGTANFQIEQIVSGGILAWTTLENSLRPAGIAPATWSVIFNNFLDEIGDTTDQYQLVMLEDADYFQSIGEPTQDVSRLLNFELEQAGDYGAIAERNVSARLAWAFPTRSPTSPPPIRPRAT